MLFKKTEDSRRLNGHCNRVSIENEFLEINYDKCNFIEVSYIVRLMRYYINQSFLIAAMCMK